MKTSAFAYILKASALAAVLAFGLVSCVKNSEVPVEEESFIPEGYADVPITISLGDAEINTKVSAYTTLQSYEKVVNDLQVIVAELGRNKIEKRLTLSDFNITTSGNVTTATSKTPVRLSAGRKNLMVFANGPDFSSATEYMDVYYPSYYRIQDYYDPSSDFLMSGWKTFLVNAGGSTSVSVTAVRKVARLALVNVTNSLPSGQNMTNVFCFIANARNNFCTPYSYTSGIGAYVDNAMGRTTSTSHNNDPATLTSGYIASYNTVMHKELMGANLGTITNGSSFTTAKLMYSCPVPPAEGQTYAYRPWLIIGATINGTLYYYNLPLPDLEENTSYTVGATITALGADRPCVELETGTVNISITKQPWQAGDTVTANY